MNKFILISITLLISMMTGCIGNNLENEYDSDGNRIKRKFWVEEYQNPNPLNATAEVYYIGRVHMRKHEYLIVKLDGVMQMVHNPDCACHKHEITIPVTKPTPEIDPGINCWRK